MSNSVNAALGNAIPPPPEGSDILPASEVESPALLLESGDKDDSDGN